jgi:anti-sigma factor RsiW
MITCRQLIEFLIDYVSGEMHPDHRALVDKHLRGCPPCVSYVETYQLTIKMTRQLPCAPIPDGLRERLLASFQEIRRGRCSDASETGDSQGL